MKLMKKFVCLLSITAMLLVCTGCIEGFLAESKETVLLKLSEYIGDRTPTSATVALDFAMNTEINGTPTEIAVLLESSTLTPSETESYGEGSLICNFNGQEIRDGAQVYNFTEDGKLLTFTHVDSKDRWIGSESALPEQQPASTPTLSLPETYGFLLLEEGSQPIGDVQAYTLTGSLDGEDCKTLLLDSLNLDALTARLQKLAPDGTDVSSIDLASLDYSPLSADVTVYLNKADCSLLQIEVTLNGANLLIGDFLSILPTHISTLFGHTVTVQPIHITFSEIGFDPVTVPPVPEEARLLAAQETFDPDRGDGSYVLQLHGNAIQFAAPTDLAVTKLGSAYAEFQNGNNSRAVHIELYRETPAETFFTSVENGMIPAMEAHELTPITASEAPIGDYQIRSITSNGVNIYAACRPIGKHLLGIYVQDSSGADCNSALASILSSIEDYIFDF